MGKKLFWQNYGKKTGKNHKEVSGNPANPLLLLARPVGFEPTAYGFVVRHSIQLSYGRTSLSDFHVTNFALRSKDKTLTGVAG
jgi:hypothetical protein